MASRNIFTSFLWQYGEKLLVQGISFIVTIILARLLIPEEYGIISIAMIYIAILEVFVNSGLGSALVQKKDVSSVDYSTAFYFSLLISIIFYICFYFISPWISKFYSNEVLCTVLQIMSIRIVLSSLQTVQNAYIQRHFLFKRGFYASLISTVVSAILGIITAYLGYGVFALVIQYLSSSVLNVLILLFAISWHPKKEFSIRAMKELLSYGWKILCSGLLNTMFAELKGFIIGAKYDAASLAYYDKGKQFPSLVYENLNTSIGKVLFPILSKAQDDKTLVASLTSKCFQILSFLLLPILMILFVVGDSIIEILFTEKWMDATPFLRVACVTYSFVIINTVLTNAINSIGRSDLHLFVEILNIILGVIVLLLLMNYGTIYIAISVTISCFICAMARLLLCRRLIGYNIKMFLKDYCMPYIASILMLTVMIFVSKLISNVWGKLLILPIIGAVVYLLVSFVICRSHYTTFMLYYKKIVNNV